MSHEATDFIEKLICDKEDRFGAGASVISDIKNHAWFKGLDWTGLLRSRAPFLPELNSDSDTQYFDEISESQIDEMFRSDGDHDLDGEELDPEVLEMRKRLAFVGFTYRGFGKKLKSKNFMEQNSNIGTEAASSSGSGGLDLSRSGSMVIKDDENDSIIELAQ